MDETLHRAIGRLLDQLQAGEVVEDLLLIEVDWGEHTPAVTDEPIEVTFQGSRWPLVFTDSELVLRRALCRADAAGRAILVVRGDGRFAAPLDIQARAHKGAPYRLGLRHRLYALTGRDWPPEVDYVEWRPSIERHLDALLSAAGQGRLQWAMTRSGLEEALVQAAFGVQVAGRTAPQLLADLVMAQTRSPDPPTDLERALLRGQLRLHQVAGAEIVAWAAEEAGRAKELVRTGVMMGAEKAARLSPSWGGLASLRARLISERQVPESEAFDRVIELATSTLPHLRLQTRESIVAAAQADLAGVLPPDSYNPWFPQALERESERLARRLAARDREVIGHVARLRDHVFAAQQRPRLDILDEMARLVTQWEQEAPRVASLVGVSDWATWYAHRGARLDLSALKLMRPQGTGLVEPVQRLLMNYWHWRDGLNWTFAGRFLSDYEAALHDRNTGVFGVHRILEWVVRPLLHQGQRVLLLVIDGMGWAAFWHLLDQWAAQTPGVYASQPRPALALLPSVTSVSRKGLFLNALPTDRLDDEETYQQKARVSEAQALQGIFPEHTVKLYHKANLDGGQQLIEELHFSNTDLTAVILNDIDEDLRSTTATVRLFAPSDIGLLDSVVRHALDANWMVVVTADHGHTWHRDKSLRRGEIIPGGGERFAPVASAKVTPTDAIVTQDPHIVRVQDGKYVALLTATGTYFGQQPRRGYHGGASLEEIVVPCTFLTREAPTALAGVETAISESAGPRPAPPSADDLAGVVLTLPDGRVRSLDLPLALTPLEARLLQTLARLGEASESELKQALGTRRVSGPLATLRERLMTAGPGYDYIEEKGVGSDGAVYRFRTEMVK